MPRSGSGSSEDTKQDIPELQDPEKHDPPASYSSMSKFLPCSVPKQMVCESFGETWSDLVCLRSRPHGTALGHFVRVNRNSRLLPNGLPDWKAAPSR